MVVNRKNHQSPLNFNQVLICHHASWPCCELSLKVMCAAHHMVPNAVPVSSVSWDTSSIMAIESSEIIVYTLWLEGAVDSVKLN